MFDFFGKRNLFFALSGLVIIAGIIGLIVNQGFVMDIEFQGGTMIQFEMKDGNFEPDKAAELASSAVGKRISGKKSFTVDTTNNDKVIDTLILSISTQGSLNSEERGKVVDAIKKEFKVNEDKAPIVDTVHPTIGNELKINSLKAVIIASILMLLYVWIRFNIMSGLFAGVTAVIALIHDVGIMLSVYALFGIPLNESFIAAVLTIVGYSMNDTIVIYDRIRENSKLLRKESIESMVNKSILQSLSRTINTTATTLLCVLTIYLFSRFYNIGSVQEFTFPLIVGLTSGTYSSIFIASPLWVMWKQGQARRQLSEKTV